MFENFFRKRKTSKTDPCTCHSRTIHEYSLGKIGRERQAFCLLASFLSRARFCYPSRTKKRTVWELAALIMPLTE